MKRIIGLFFSCFILSILIVCITGTIKYADKHIKVNESENITSNTNDIENNDVIIIEANNRKLTKVYIIIIGVLLFFVSLIIMYAIMSGIFGHRVFKGRGKFTIYMIGSIVLTTALLFLTIMLGNKELSRAKRIENSNIQSNENSN